MTGAGGDLAGSSSAAVQLAAPCSTYVADLNAAAEKLAEIARSYQISEDAIGRSFVGIGPRW